MDEQEYNSKTYDFIIEHFKEERMRSRYEWLYDLMLSFIEAERMRTE